MRRLWFALFAMIPNIGMAIEICPIDKDRVDWLWEEYQKNENNNYYWYPNFVYAATEKCGFKDVKDKLNSCYDTAVANGNYKMSKWHLAGAICGDCAFDYGNKTNDEDKKDVGISCISWVMRIIDIHESNNSLYPTEDSFNKQKTRKGRNEKNKAKEQGLPQLEKTTSVPPQQHNETSSKNLDNNALCAEYKGDRFCDVRVKECVLRVWNGWSEGTIPQKWYDKVAKYVNGEISRRGAGSKSTFRSGNSYVECEAEHKTLADCKGSAAGKKSIAERWVLSELQEVRVNEVCN